MSNSTNNVTVVQQSVQLSADGQGPSTIIEVSTRGPQGAASKNLGDLQDLDVAGVVNGSTLVYDEATGRWVGNDSTTVTEIVNGGNF